ncbi:MAG: DUF3500 domain-containing protein [Acidobacteria bacterium]|nr:DUF3500 domain-containing protein [Acidobacteriota bacterium]
MFFACSALLLGVAGLIRAQGPGGGGITDTFKGITTDGNIIAGLFPLQTTGVSTEPVRLAAAAFLASLTDAQRAATVYAADNIEWRQWSNVDGYARQGVSLAAMTDAQKTAAMSLLAAALSTKGLETAKNVMKLNTTEGELLNQLTRFNENLYYFTVMGTPSATDPWGFQLDGHHLVINFFVRRDQVVMAPVFMGAEPAVATTGAYKGVSVLQTEQNKGLAMINALTATQRATAISSSSKPGDDLKAGANGDNTVLPYQGIKGSDLTNDQRAQLLDLIGEWVGNMRDGHAAVKMEEVARHLDNTYFSWRGGIGCDAVFYYRVQSPVILIEFDHEQPGPLGQNPAYASSVPTRTHIHSIARTPNGNDYGKDLLRQHLLAYDHVRTKDGVVHVARKRERKPAGRG